MSERLSISVDSVTASHLKIKVKNTSAAALTENLEIELNPPKYLVDKRIAAASEAAPTSKKPRNKKSLGDVVTVAQGWSVWAMLESSGTVAVVQVFNYYDQKTGEQVNKPVRFEAGAEFVVSIPLNPEASKARLQITYSYLYGEDDREQQVRGTLDVKPPGADDWKPEVTLKSDQQNPNMIPPGRKVKISWEIKDGVSATLRGPLPGGNPELELKDSDPNFKLASGSIEIVAVGPMTYILQAEVRREGKTENERVDRMISLDTYEKGKYSYVKATPNRVLRNGLVEVYWAAWGVKDVTILINGGATRKIPLTEQNAFRTYQGDGVMRFNSMEEKREYIGLQIRVGQAQPSTDSTAEVDVVSWKKLEKFKPAHTGKPIGLAAAGGKLALLTGDGLFTAQVGEYDPGSVPMTPVFSKAATDTPKAWLAISPLENGFVVLRRTSNDDLQVARYLSSGKPDGEPIDLDGYLKPMVRRSDTIYDLVGVIVESETDPLVSVVLAFVVVETPVPGGSVRRAFSVRFKPTAQKRDEPLLESLKGYRLVSFDRALYALSRESGRMFRFGLANDGKLEPPSEAACAAENLKSMVQQGLFVPVGSVFTVLGPTSVPSLAALATFGLQNVLSYESLTQTEPEDPNKILQDLVYNPQTNHWARSGQELDIKAGAVAAYRSGGSPRLWVLQDGEIHTLAVGSEYLFATDFNETFPTKDLPHYFDGKREVTIANQSGVDLVPVDDICRFAGLDDFSSSGSAALTPIRVPFENSARKKFEIAFNKAAAEPVKLRFMGKEPPAAGPRYVLEITFTGPGLSSVTSVFKRLAVDTKGAVSIVDVSRTSAQHPAGDSITIPAAEILTGGSKLVIANGSPFDLTLTPSKQAPPFRSIEEVLIKHNTPSLSLSSPTLGELRFDIDCALPDGIETSSGDAPQQRMIRINPDKAPGMEIRQARMLNPGEVIWIPYQLDSTTTVFSDRSGKKPAYVCQIGYGMRKDLPAVYIGDGVSNKDDRYFYLPGALPQDPSKAQILRVDSQTFAHTASDSFPAGPLFSLPNAVAVTSNKVFAMFGNTDLYEFSQTLQFSKKTSFARRSARNTWPLQLKATASGGIYVLAKIQDFIDRTQYVLLAEGLPKNTQQHQPFPPREDTETIKEIAVSDLSDQRNAFPQQQAAAVFESPMAVSPDGKLVVIAQTGGFRTVTFSAIPQYNWLQREVAQPAAVVFSDNGYFYFLNYPSSPGGLKLTRVEAANMRNVRTISLPPIEGDFNIGPDPKQFGPAAGELNHARACSLAVAPGGDYVYATQGKSILQIHANSMEVRPWRATVDLPCRLITVKRGPAYRTSHGEVQTDLLFAIGAKVESDGKKVKEYKTQLYALAAPR
ncbi:MAG TPA: hypothetical protein VN937_18710 [Blastocatellia bacterium]|nr:hypothetical protein [Blastocatellia bacterium]